MKLAFDIEADGFLDTVTKIHCIVLTDVVTGEKWKCAPEHVQLGIDALMNADEVIGHNIIQYDLPVIEKLYNVRIDPNKVVDTLTLSRLAFTDLSDEDQKRRAFEGTKLKGKHSLEAWGLRFNYPKVSYDDWTVYTPEMLERCSTDVDITVRLYNYILKQKLDPRAWTLEHKVQFILARQETYGYPFDVAKAEAFTASLRVKLYEIEKKVQDTFKPFYTKNGKEAVYKKDNVQHFAGPYQKIKLTIFNPASRHHIANRLKFLYGWEPSEFTPKGEPKIDEKVLEVLPWPEAQLLAKYFKLNKRLALVSDGEKGWLKNVRVSGGQPRIHGSIIANGAVTGRGTHILIANVPRVTSFLGPECRELFTSSRQRVEVGVDAPGLELRMFADYLSQWDGGAYAAIVTQGDVHSSNQDAAGLPSRDHAKTFIYAFLYGAGDTKLGRITDPLLKDGPARSKGTKLRKMFITRVPGLGKLIDKVQLKAKQQGYLKGLDGRRLKIRKAHSALNTLLQSAGAIVCKQWMVEIDEELTRRGLHNEVQQLIWYHDEFQFDVVPEYAEQFGELAMDALDRAGKFFGITVPLTSRVSGKKDYKIGKNWKECH